MNVDLMIEIFGAVIGLLYIFFEYKASSKLWIVGIVMSLFYIYIFAQAHCYFWASTYLYYLIADIYGIISWKNQRHTDISPYEGMKKLRAKQFFLLLVIAIVGSFVLSLFAKKIIPDSAAPIGEAISTILSVIAMWMLAKKYIEQWILWIVVNLFYAVLNFMIALYPTAILFSVYVVVAIMGYLKWRKSMRPIEETPHQL